MSLDDEYKAIQNTRHVLRRLSVEFLGTATNLEWWRGMGQRCLKRGAP